MKKVNLLAVGKARMTEGVTAAQPELKRKKPQMFGGQIKKQGRAC